jgi:hypothetical protein
MYTTPRTVKPTLSRIQSYLDLELKEDDSSKDHQCFFYSGNSILIRCYGNPNNLTSVQITTVLRQGANKENSQFFWQCLSHIIASLYARKEVSEVQRRLIKFFLAKGGSFDFHGDRFEVRHTQGASSGRGILTIFFQDTINPN